MKKILLLCLVSSLVLSGCMNPVNPPGGRVQIVTMDLELDAVFSQVVGMNGIERGLIVGYKSAGFVVAKGPEMVTGDMNITNIDTGEWEIVKWYARMDEANYSIESNKQVNLKPGNYTFSLLFDLGGRQYLGETAGEVGDGENIISMSLKPVIGSVSADSNETQRSKVRFQYPAVDLASLGNPRLGYIVDSGQEYILEFNSTKGFDEAYFDYTAGSHTLELKLYDGSKQIGKSQASQEVITFGGNNSHTMDLVPLRGKTGFSMSLTGGESSFSFRFPGEIAEEAGGIGNLAGYLQVSGPVIGPRGAVEMTLSESNGDIVSQVVFSDFKYDTVNLSVTFKDIARDEVVASSIKEGVLLDVNDRNILLDVFVFRRSIVSGALLGNMGISVYDTAGIPQGNMDVYLNGQFVGKTEDNITGTPGYFEQFLEKGRYIVKVIDGGTLKAGIGVAEITPMGIVSLDILLDKTAWNNNKHVYEVINRNVTWTEARAICEEQGGHLATITSQEENDYITGLAAAANENCWLGGTDDPTQAAGASEGVWQWITGETWSYTNWNEGEPNNEHGGTEHYLHFWNPATPGKIAPWNDLRNDFSTVPDVETVYILCEWE